MKVLILNSAHGKYPVGKEPWIQATVKLVDMLARKNVTLLCSTEPSPWDLATYLAGRHRMNVELIVKAGNNDAGEAEFCRILDHCDLDSMRTTPLYLEKTYRLSSYQKKIWQARDRFAVEKAHVIYPVSIRPGGRLDHIMSSEQANDKVRNDFRIHWSKSGNRPDYEFKGRTVNPLPSGNWLVHWTRASQGPWPGEKARQFYRDLLDNPAVYVRNAEATLARILGEQHIRGSSWKIPGDERAIAFTALSIEDALPLMRWRKRFVRYTFEPYGIAVRRSALIDCGARAVCYNREETDDSKYDRLFVHAPGEITDWTREKEWRIRGDLSLEKIDKRDLIALVPDYKTKREIHEKAHRDISVHVIFQ